MKIAHVINGLSAGGAELHLLALCRRLRQDGIEVVVAYLKEGRGSRSLRPEFERAGIRVVPLGGQRPWDGRYVLRAFRWIKRERPDLLHTHLPRADLAGFLIRLLVPSIPWICSVHDIHSKSWRGRWALPLFRVVWRRADRIIAISEAVKAWLVRDYGIRAEKVQVVHYGIERERFVAPSQDLRSAWGLGEGPIVGTVGRLERRKGHDLLIQAMPLILRHVPRATLLIAGHDPWGYGRTLRSLVRQLGLDGRVRFVGFQSDICSFLHAVDVFAFASRSEGFGQVVIEAMAAGRPVVVPRIEPFTEIVVNGKTGFCVEPERPEALAEAIVWVLCHREKAKEMGERGVERVYELFSSERMTEQTLRLYRECLSKNR